MMKKIIRLIFLLAIGCCASLPVSAQITNAVLDATAGQLSDGSDGIKLVVTNSGGMQVFKYNYGQWCCSNPWSSNPDAYGSWGGLLLKFRFEQQGNATVYTDAISLTSCGKTEVTGTGTAADPFKVQLPGTVTSPISGKTFYVTIIIAKLAGADYFYTDYYIRAPLDLVTPERVNIYLDEDDYIGYNGPTMPICAIPGNATNPDHGFAFGHVVGGGYDMIGTKNGWGSHFLKISGAFDSYYDGHYSSRSTLAAGTIKLTNLMQAGTHDIGVAIHFSTPYLSAGQSGVRRLLQGYGPMCAENTYDSFTVIDPVAPGVPTQVTARFADAAVSELEGNASHTASGIKIRVSGGVLAQDQLVSIVASGTPSDFNYQQAVVIPAGNYMSPVDLDVSNLTINGNTTPENNRNISITLQSGCNDLVVIAAPNTCVYTILDDDATVNAVTNSVLCNGETLGAIVFTGSSNSPLFSWTNSNTSIGLPASGTAGTPSFTAANTGTTPVVSTVTVTPSKNGVNGTPTSFTITVNPSTRATDITASNVTICSGATAALSATAGSITSPVFKWYADNITGTPLATGASYTTAALATGTYTYYVSVSGTGACENPAGSRKAVTVTVNRNAAVADITVNNVTICSGATATLSATAGSITGPVFKWYADNTTATSLATGASYTTAALTTGTYTYYVSVSGTGVCESPAGGRKAITVTVNRNASTADITASNVAICNGATATLSATAGGITSPVFTWYADNTTVTSLATGASYTTAALAIGTYTYYVSVSGTGVCENPIGSRKAVTVTVNPLPVPTINGNASPCAGSRQTYTTEAGMTGYAWTVTGGTIVSGQNTSSFVVDWGAAGTGSLTVTYTNGNGCTPVSPTSQTITINPVPSPTVSGIFSVWQNSTWTYTTETGMNTYVWTVTGGTILSGQGTSSVSVKWTSGTSGTIKVSYRTPATCFADMTSPQTVTISNAELTLSFAPTSIDEGSSSIGTVCLPSGTGAPTGGLVVALARKASSTAVAADYTMPISVTIPVGQRCVDFTLSATTDDLVEGSEQLDITATATGLAVAEASITINDRTPGDVMVERTLPSNGNASEPSTNGQFRIRFREPNVTSTKNTQVTYTMSGTAVNGTDYATVSGITTIPLGQKGVDIPITVINNFKVEGPRTVNITITAATSL